MKVFPAIVGSLFLCLYLSADDSPSAGKGKDASYYNRLLGRGINLGNALEAPKEGGWGLTIEADYFKRIKEAGFQSVRVPIRWSAHAGAEAPYTIDDAFFQRIDWVIDQALSRGLAIVINVHHYDELLKDPDKHRERFLSLWKQIAGRYRQRPEQLYFEILNEPHSKLTDELWNRMSAEVLAVIRASNPRRMVIVGPSQWNSVHRLEKLNLPDDDRMLIATFHYYEPHHFTHQGAPWAAGSNKWKGTIWPAGPKDLEALDKDFAKAAAWAKKMRRPLYLGEFGAYSEADMDSRVRWTKAVARAADQHGFSWAYWEFGAGFGAYDPRARAWRQPLLKALLDKP
jgi:endoglucanase